MGIRDLDRNEKRTRRTIGERMLRRFAGSKKGFNWSVLRIEERTPGVWSQVFAHCPSVTDLSALYELRSACDALIEELSLVQKELNEGRVVKLRTEAA